MWPHGKEQQIEHYYPKIHLQCPDMRVKLDRDWGVCIAKQPEPRSVLLLSQGSSLFSKMLWQVMELKETSFLETNPLSGWYQGPSLFLLPVWDSWGNANFAGSIASNNLIAERRDTISLECVHSFLPRWLHLYSLSYMFSLAIPSKSPRESGCVSGIANPTGNPGCSWSRSKWLSLGSTPTDRQLGILPRLILSCLVCSGSYIPEGFGAFCFSLIISSLDAFLLLPGRGFDKFRGHVELCVLSTLPYFLTVFSDSVHEKTCSVAPWIILQHWLAAPWSWLWEILQSLF